MRRFLFVATLAGLLASAHPAAAEPAGHVGIGGAQTLGGVRGIDVMYWAGKVGVNGTAALLFSSPDGADSGLAVQLAGGVLFALVGGDSAQLSFGGRIDLAAAKNRDPQWDIEAPLRLEWFPSPHLGLHGEVGVAVEIVGDRGRILAGAGSDFFGSGPGTGFIIGGTFVTAGGGFDVYF